MLPAMDERQACDHLKRRFEGAGFRIAENVELDDSGVRFEVDGFDAERRVGYEYVSAEAGDGWDVDADVIETLAARHKAGALHILVIDEHDAPDAGALDRAVDRFLTEVKSAPKAVAKPAAKPTAARSEPAAKPAAKKPPPTPPKKKPAAKAKAKKR